MTKPLLLTCLAAFVLCSGCMFSRKSRSRENTSIAGEVQETFRKRWVEKRVADLVAQGTTAEAARTQAEAEFLKAYDFSSAAGK